MSPPTLPTRFAPVVISALTLLIFCVALAASGVIAWAKGDYTLLIAMAGVAATNFTTVVGYWVGSSDSSAKKTALLAQTPTPGATP